MGVCAVILVEIVGGGARATQPSFDCYKATLADEFAICANDTLSILDNIANSGYQYLRLSMGSKRANQIDLPFIVARQSCGSDQRCVFSTQIAAIKAFRLYGAPVVVPYGVSESFLTTEEAAARNAAEEVNKNAQLAQQVKINADAASVKMSADAAYVMNRKIGELEAQIGTLTKVLGEQRAELGMQAGGEKQTVEQTISSIAAQIDHMSAEYKEKSSTFSEYLTSIKPNDKDVYMTARVASLSYPKIPYYIPGTSETGEFWVEPTVTDAGELMFNFRLIDPGSANETTRSLILMNIEQLQNTQGALFKLHKMSVTAHENKVRANYSKRVICFTYAQCPEERRKGEKGNTSTEILFEIYEDGSTAGRIQLNKGAFQEGFNVSIDSGLLLQAYLSHVIKEAKSEFESGTRTSQDLDKMFQ